MEAISSYEAHEYFTSFLLLLLPHLMWCCELGRKEEATVAAGGRSTILRLRLSGKGHLATGRRDGAFQIRGSVPVSGESMCSIVPNLVLYKVDMPPRTWSIIGYCSRYYFYFFRVLLTMSSLMAIVHLMDLPMI
jgi:hypothetical protein